MLFPLRVKSFLNASRQGSGVRIQENLFIITPINLAPQESALPLETMSHFEGTVIPDESALAGEIRNQVKAQHNEILSGSRLASAVGGLGRDDEL